MSTITLEIDGKKVTAPEGTTIIQAAKQAGIDIPNLCHDERLKPSGACRLCMVEIQKKNRTRLVASCVYTVEEGLVVKTTNEKIKKIRSMIVELLWPTLSGMAKKYGLTQSRFEPKNTECNLCGKCVRYCNEVKKAGVAYFEGRGIDRKVGIIPGMENECNYCNDCFNTCPAGKIVLMCDGVNA
jgi:bidirectional [NiFe] hydrogenase diaphorase subunit